MNEEKLRKLIASHEGLRLRPYFDTVGKLTIGYGRNIQDRGISREEAEFLLANDIRDTIKDLHTALPWLKDESEVRQAVFIDMAFNMGIVGFLKFKTTIALVKEGKYVDASEQMLESRWAHQVKGRAKELSEMMASNSWGIRLE